MPVSSTIISGRYLDSVKLMQISKKLREREGVKEAVAISATPENKAILRASGMLLDEFSKASSSDICLAVEAESQQLADSLIEEAGELIATGMHGKDRGVIKNHNPRSVERALNLMPEANLVLISIAGRYAAAEAGKSLELGRHVMLFSDNVSLEDEKKLKEQAIARGFLMMGPDCGTAIINGVSLGFANSVRRGKIGIVSAAGTGLQEVSSVIHNNGGGISQAFGTGGRDGRTEIGGLMLEFCLDYLLKDTETEVIVIISKPPDDDVIEKLWNMLRGSDKHVIVNFLKPLIVPDLSNVVMTTSLREAGIKACQILTGKEIFLKSESRFMSAVELPEGGQRRYLRGLYSGGTLCYEAQTIFQRKTGHFPFSNTPAVSSAKLSDTSKSIKNTVIDMGADEFTIGRPHPMIDFSLRLSRMEEESRDRETAVILFDVVLGFGAHPEPHEELVPVLGKIRDKGGIMTVCSVTGTDQDRQNRRLVIEELHRAGAAVFETNAEAVEHAAYVIGRIAGE